MNFRLPSLGWVWIFSETAHEKVLEITAGIQVMVLVIHSSNTCLFLGTLMEGHLPESQICHHQYGEDIANLNC